MLNVLKQKTEYYSDPTRSVLRPIRPSLEEIYNIRSEVSTFPYTHFFRGKISPYPHVFDRRAGWSPQMGYAPTITYDKLPRHCFQAPCNTVFTQGKDCDGKCVNMDCVNTYR